MESQHDQEPTAPRIKPYDLELRTELFAQQVRAMLRKVRRTVSNLEDGKQLIRSSGSVAANYIEAREALGKKDFRMRIRIARKEAKESRLWLRLLDLGNEPSLVAERTELVNECFELVKIFTAILKKGD